MKRIISVLVALCLSGCVSYLPNYLNPTMDLSERLEVLKRNNPDWDTETVRDVAGKRVSIGMTKAQVRASWGYPSDINRSVGSWGVHEQWVYGGYNHVYGYYSSPQYLYFEGDTLTSFQD